VVGGTRLLHALVLAAQSPLFLHILADDEGLHHGLGDPLLLCLQVFPGQSLIVRAFNTAGKTKVIDDVPNYQFELDVPCYCPTAAAVREWSQGVAGKATGSEIFIVEDGSEVDRRSTIENLAPSAGGISYVTSETPIRSIITAFQFCYIGWSSPELARQTPCVFEVGKGGVCLSWKATRYSIPHDLLRADLTSVCGGGTLSTQLFWRLRSTGRG
jgi:hypothetical protein